MKAKATKVVKTVKAKSAIKDLPVSVNDLRREATTLIDRHGQECGYILYSQVFKPDCILMFHEDSPRNVTLETWQRWGKQAESYAKLRRFEDGILTKKKKKTKAKTKKKTAKKGGK